MFYWFYFIFPFNFSENFFYNFQTWKIIIFHVSRIDIASSWTFFTSCMNHHLSLCSFLHNCISKMTKQAVLLSDRAKGITLPGGSHDYVDKSSNMTRFRSNVTSKTISVLLRLPVVGKMLNRVATGKAASSGTNRPFELSCKSDYTSYESLTDYSYYGRHLPSAIYCCYSPEK